MREMIKSKMRNLLVRLLKDNEIILSVYNFFYRCLNTKKFHQEVNRRKQLSIFDYRALSEDLHFCPIERVKDSNFYGQAYSFKNYANVLSVNYAIEHGLYFDNYIPKASYLSTTHQILTMSNVRKEVLSKSLNKEVLTVGPYIHYAQSLLTELEYNSLKGTLGKVLLFFPTHTCKDGGESYDLYNTINHVKAIATEKQCDSVLVCMYYRDIMTTNYAKEYETVGFKVVTAGHQLDLYFLSRLKTIISLSDYTISNNVGTHTGYCIYLGKPHYIFQKDLVLGSPYNQFKEIGQAFFEDSDTIDNYQYQIVSKYWGVDCIKSKDELKKYLSK